MITLSAKGDWSTTINWLKRANRAEFFNILDSYGKRGVDALSEATPVKTGKTASSWSYEVQKQKNGAKIYWKNSNVEDRVPIVVLIQYGHATKGGGYVQGYDFINPAIKPVIEDLLTELERELK